MSHLYWRLAEPCDSGNHQACAELRCTALKLTGAPSLIGIEDIACGRGGTRKYFYTLNEALDLKS